MTLPTKETLLGEAGPQKHLHILIIGAGITGLVFAQGLRKFNDSPAAATYPIKFTYSVYERDTEVLYRGGGYSLSLHWCLPYLEDILRQEILDGMHECLCNVQGVEEGLKGKFQYLNLRTAVPSLVVTRMSVSRLLRVSRERLIRLFMTGIDVQFSKQLSEISWPSEDTVTAHFKDGTTATGGFLLGADGSNSKVRQILCGKERGQNTALPVNMLGFRCNYPREKISKILDMDPYIVMGGDPVLNTYFWFSFLYLPRPTAAEKEVECHMVMSWPTEDPYPGGGKAPEIPETNEERQALARRLSTDWAEPMREMVQDLPKDTIMREISNVEWYPVKGMWSSHGGRITMVGDAAHAASSCEYILARYLFRNVEFLTN